MDSSRPDPVTPHPVTPDPVTPDPVTPEPVVLDPGALRRRVLLAGAVTLVLFFTTTYVLTALQVSSLWLLPVLALVWALVVRPLMRPVREASALRRRLAYRAFLAGREDGR